MKNIDYLMVLADAYAIEAAETPKVNPRNLVARTIYRDRLEIKRNELRTALEEVCRDSARYRKLRAADADPDSDICLSAWAQDVQDWLPACDDFDKFVDGLKDPNEKLR